MLMESNPACTWNYTNSYNVLSIQVDIADTLREAGRIRLPSNTTEVGSRVDFKIQRNIVTFTQTPGQE
jgi:hypothetical protein